MAADRRRKSVVTLRVIPMNSSGELIIDEYENMLNERTKMVAVAHVSNSLGTVNPIKEMVATATSSAFPYASMPRKACRIFPWMFRTLIAISSSFRATRCSARQAAACFTASVNGWTKCLRIRPAAGIIPQCHFEKTTFAPIPDKFEAGTPAIAAGIGLGAAIDYINAIDFEAAAAYEHELLEYATNVWRHSGREDHRDRREKGVGFSFTIENVHPHESARSSIRKASPCVPATTAHSR